MELVRERELDLARERAPVVRRERSRALDDLAELLRRHVTAEVDAVEAEPARDGDVLRRHLDEERAALVGARRVPLDQREQLVGHDDAGDLARVERARRRPRQQVHVGEHRRGRRLAPDEAQQLVVLARAPADLVDHEPCSGAQLLLQLEVLRHHLALVPLVIRDDAPEEEVRPVEPHVRPSRVRQPVVHLREEAEQTDRVDVEHRRRDAAVPGDLIVARQREHVVEPLRAELPPAALERVAIPVLAGEVDDHLLAARDEIGAERVRREHRVAAGVVGDREDVDARILRERARSLEHLSSAVGRDQAAARHELRGDDERSVGAELLAQWLGAHTANGRCGTKRRPAIVR